jgi:hypothetical protein
VVVVRPARFTDDTGDIRELAWVLGTKADARLRDNNDDDDDDDDGQNLRNRMSADVLPVRDPVGDGRQAKRVCPKVKRVPSRIEVHR